MLKLGSDPAKWLRKKAKKGGHGWPAGTVAFYGPHNQRASKLVATIVAGPDEDPDPMRKWFAESGDLRLDLAVMREAAEFFKQNGVSQINMVDVIIGCPHEEGIDYPEDEPCPKCPFWAHRDRFTHELEDDKRFAKAKTLAAFGAAQFGPKSR